MESCTSDAAAAEYKSYRAHDRETIAVSAVRRQRSVSSGQPEFDRRASM
jgi:hypothetical protein